MDNRYYDKVIGEMQSFFDDQNFTSKDDGTFINDKKSVRIEYDEAKQMYILSAADVEDGSVGEYSSINSWLFDDSQNEKDALSVGIDFKDTLRKNMGIKIKRKALDGTDVALPTASKSGSMTVAGFTKKLLDIFPVLKEPYKTHIATYGNFLYLNFFGESVVPQLKKLLDTSTKKQLKKIDDVFEDVYIHGDKESVNALVVLLCAASYKDEKAENTIKDILAENKHFLESYTALIPVFSKNKKLIGALIK